MTARGFGVVEALSRKTSGCPSSSRASSGNSGRTRARRGASMARAIGVEVAHRSGSLEARARDRAGSAACVTRNLPLGSTAMAVAVRAVELEPSRSGARRARAASTARRRVAGSATTSTSTRSGVRWFDLAQADAVDRRRARGRWRPRSRARRRAARPRRRRAPRRRASGGTVVKRRGPVAVDLHEVAHDEAHERHRDAVERRHHDERDVLRAGRRARCAGRSSTWVVNGAWWRRPSSPSMKRTPTSLAP